MDEYEKIMIDKYKIMMDKYEKSISGRLYKDLIWPFCDGHSGDQRILVLVGSYL